MTKERRQKEATGFSLDEWSTAYLDDVFDRQSTGTYREKQRAFKNFVAFHNLTSDYPVAEISKDMCRKYLTHAHKTRSGYAANKDRKNLIAAWNWAKGNLDYWDMDVNPFQTVQKFRELRNPRYIPPEEDFWAVYDAVADQQDKAMLLTFLHLAARRNEVFGLKRSDLDFQNQRARLWTNKRVGGLEYDWLPMTTELSDALAAWWKKRMEMGLTKDQHIFVCLDELPCNTERYGKPFSQRRHFMARHCKAVKVEPFVFHAIRHLSASILFHNGYSVGHIQLVLRHKSPSTTERYLKSLGLEMVREALELSFTRGNVVSLEEKRNQKEMAQSGNL